jgi:hypothetical protein
MISHFINESDHWRTRAEEARVLALTSGPNFLFQRCDALLQLFHRL